ncbi:MAG: MFS transporter [Actinomycetota bacterium]|jgi:EmrB/QacA subfamily drug resistance transporter|nr:MFS transporter [Actinomycetota bacterium]
MPVLTPRRRAAVLATLCLSVFLIVLDNTVVNVALPTLVEHFGATDSQLQWIVDAYTLVFAAFLLPAGSLGDRRGRKGTLLAGLCWFALSSLAAAHAHSADQLIALRGLMGVGAALIFPATLAILVNVFTEPRARARAISVWAATSGLSVALGPVVGGYLLEHDWWGSIFVANVPVVVVALVAVTLLVPPSRDPRPSRLDLAGLALSAVAVSLLVFSIIEAPHRGWTSLPTVAGLVGSGLLLVTFVAVERRTAHPLLDVSVFRSPRFSAASLAIAGAFFALFGFVFVVTQYFQFVRGYSTLSAGVRTVPFAAFTGLAAPLSPLLVRRFGTHRVAAAGLAAMAAGFAVAAVTTATAPYWVLVVAMLGMGGGLGLVTAPATESIMGSLPPARAGVGSAVNDTTRELGGTLGVAVVGSVFSSLYASGVGQRLAGLPVPPRALAIAKQSVGGAFAVAARAPSLAAARVVRAAASGAFMDGFHAGSVTAGATVAVLAVVTARWLAPRAARPGAATDPAARRAPDVRSLPAGVRADAEPVTAGARPGRDVTAP